MQPDPVPCVPQAALVGLLQPLTIVQQVPPLLVPTPVSFRMLGGYFVIFGWLGESFNEELHSSPAISALMTVEFLTLNPSHMFSYAMDIPVKCGLRYKF